MNFFFREKTYEIYFRGARRLRRRAPRCVVGGGIKRSTFGLMWLVFWHPPFLHLKFGSCGEWQVTIGRFGIVVARPGRRVAKTGEMGFFAEITTYEVMLKNYAYKS